MQKYCNRQSFVWLQDSILVAGYPLGGDSLSITKGIVSRVRSLSLQHNCETAAVPTRTQRVVQCCADLHRVFEQTPTLHLAVHTCHACKEYSD